MFGIWSSVIELERFKTLTRIGLTAWLPPPTESPAVPETQPPRPMGTKLVVDHLKTMRTVDHYCAECDVTWRSETPCFVCGPPADVLTDRLAYDWSLPESAPQTQSST